ncbi:MAG: EAL domain-containing protein [Rhodocyclales bacterium]|nr:EAL domain-containing protein [Rhodocyclales bacterium]
MLLWGLAAFFVALALFTSKTLIERHRDRDNALAASRWANISGEASELAHELQKERGLSSGMLASKHSLFTSALLEQRERTDVVLAHVRATLGELPQWEPSIEPLAALTDGTLAALEERRKQIDQDRVRRDEAVAYYTQAIAALFELLARTLGSGQQGDLIRQQIAFVAFLQAKEMAGLERALITAVLSSQEFSENERLELQRIKSIEETRLQQFVQLADDEAVQGFHALTLEPYVAAANLVRESIFVDASVYDAKSWFNVATRKIEAMKSVEDIVRNAVSTRAEKLEKRAHAELLINASSAGISFVLAVWLLRQVRRGRRHAELLIRDGEQRLGRLVRDLEGIAWAGDPRDGRFTLVSPRAEALLGYPREAWLQPAFWPAIVVGDERPALPDNDGGTVAVRTADGRTRWLRNIMALPRPGEEYTQARGLLLDVTEAYLTNEKLRLTAAVFSNSIEAIFICDADGRIIDVNRAFCETTGYQHDEVLGKTPSILQSGRHGDDFYAGMWRGLLDEGQWQGEIWNRRRDGAIYPGLMSAVTLRDESGAPTHFIAMTFDLSQHKHTEAMLEQLRTFDPLTALPNRDAWRNALDQTVADHRVDRRRFAVLEIGLDRFKLINESLGHGVGDQVLAEAAARIKQTLRRHDVAARPGGDHFSALLADATTVQDVTAACEKILARMTPAFNIDNHELAVSVSIGAALFPDDGDDAATLTRNAESAMHRAKAEGRSIYVFYSTEMNAEGERTLRLERLLRVALDERQFSLAYQPQVRADDATLVGVEALLRWQSPELGAVSPVQFIPVAEETGLIVPLGEWTLREACRQAAAWRRLRPDGLPVAVNLSPRQFRRQDVVSTVKRALDDAGLPGRLLELEITEGSLVADPAGAVRTLGELKALGVKVALDDFGTGYSSLAYLKTFPLDRLKIDRAFVRNLPHDRSDASISRTIIALGRNLDLEVLAEGVETAEQQQFLRAEGCHVIQGYLHGKPMPAADIDAQLTALAETA